jgi:ABC-type polysaccharide/polyol phosphate transport system ATPase subunit
MLKSNYTTWKTVLLHPFARRRQDDYVTVLDGLDLSVPPGRTMAIIGQNGSGKSTLLKILAGIYKADQGEVRVRGRVASLIELGAGFHPEFTGRENVFLNGAILGLSKQEVRERFEDILAFSGLGPYIDSPVRTYSSGMYVRLGFSVAVNVDPDVLLVDEVLAVGDEAFAHKCEDKINQFRNEGKTIFMVTHDMSAVEKYADEVIWLDGGDIAAQGDPLQVIDAYRQKVALAEDAIRREEGRQEKQEKLEQERWGDGDAVITDVRVLDAQGEEKAVFDSGDALTVEIDYELEKRTEDLVFGVAINNTQGVQCYGTNTHIDRVDLGLAPIRGTVRISMERLDLVEGSYTLDAAAHAQDGRAYDYITRVMGFAVRSSVGDTGVFRPPHAWELIPREESP